MLPSRGQAATEKKKRCAFAEFSWLAKDALLDHDDKNEKYNYHEKDAPITTEKAITIAAFFLMDYEAGRAPTLSSYFHRITDHQLNVYRLEFSSWWRWIGLYPATFLLFVTYFQSRIWTTIFHVYAVLILLVDLYLRHSLLSPQWHLNDERKMERNVHAAMLVFLIVLGIQSCLWFLWAHPEDHLSTMVTALFKPLVFFYLSRRARDALEALIKIGKIIARVILIELFLILTFAAVACRLYYNDDGFQSLAKSWLSLFQLSTTVVNPSLWMPAYSQGRSNAIFFVLFIVVCVFYLHSLILSVVFQVFIQAATEVHQRSVVDKEDSIKHAYLVLSSTHIAKQPIGEVHVELIRDTLKKLRPHYLEMKIDILMELVDPLKKQSLDFSTFRITVREALDSSIRSARRVSMFGNAVDMLSVFVTIANFLFVTLLTSEFQAGWFIGSIVVVGSLITSFCIIELGMRCNISTMTYYPMTRLNGVFDGFAAVGGIVSCYGVCAYCAGNHSALDFLLTGRAIDMVRTMRFFPMFRDVVERSVNVLPALAGPVSLVLTTVHVFVCIGMALWRGQVDANELSNNVSLQPLYSLNNFNSYSEGLVTIFNVLVVNDWHEIAKVFLYADQHSHPAIVYPFFVTVVLIAVCVMLNVITAFFVETFVTRLSKDDMENDGVIRLQKAQAEFSVMTPKSSNRALFSQELKWRSFMGADSLKSSVSSDSGHLVHFDLFERQGFDRIMQTVANSAIEQEDIAKCICEMLETVSALSMATNDDVGFLVACRPSMSQYHTPGFRNTVSEFLDDLSLHSIVCDLTTQSSSGTARLDNSRRHLQHFIHPSISSIVLDLSVIPLPHVPDMWLFVARRRHVHNHIIGSA